MNAGAAGLDAWFLLPLAALLFGVLALAPLGAQLSLIHI